MSCKSAIYTVNNSIPTLAANALIPFGSIVRRFGPALDLNGNGIFAEGSGYFDVYVTITATPTAVGPVTIQLYQDGVAVPGALKTVYAATANQPIGLDIHALIRNVGCYANSMLAVGISAEAAIDNFATVVEKL